MTQDSLQRIGRTVLQLIAGGGLSALIDQLVLDLPDPYNIYFPLVVAFIVTVIQNAMEDSTGKDILIPKTPQAHDVYFESED